MSRETFNWLNNNILIGQTDKRGKAWHFSASEQGEESNHYPGFIPAADVKRRLHNWHVIMAPLFTDLPDGRQIPITDRQVMVRSDNGFPMGIFKMGYESHDFNETLVGGLSNILGETIGMSSAGLLKGGAVGWVEASVPDSILTPEGVEFRPNILAVTSHDGSHATTYKRTITNTVCDNTMSMALAERGQVHKIRHSKNSKLKIDDAREALAIIHETGDTFAAEVKRLCETTVTDKQWQAFLDTTVPIGDDKGRGQTLAVNKQDALKRLWTRDNMVSPWAGTAWGVVQAVNTWTTHEATVKNMHRVERKWMSTVKGEFDTLDVDTMVTLDKILANA